MSGSRAGATNLTKQDTDRVHSLQARGRTPAQVAAIMGRDKSTICRHFNRSTGDAPVGRPAVLTDEMIDKLESTIEQMIKAADSKY